MPGLRSVEVDACPLCGSAGPLRDSHIVPHFVYEWLRETSATGFIRYGPIPNRRVQDGFKQKLLCASCEEMLSKWESETARLVFRPYHHDSGAVLEYGPWFSKFCASVCWRVLFLHRGLGIPNYSPAQNEAADNALAHWRAWMFDRVPNPGRFELHVVPVDLIGDFEGIEPPTNINRYVARAIEIDAISSARSAYVYAKLCKLVLVGAVQLPAGRQWIGTRVAAKRGTIRPDNRTVPSQLWGYMADRARAMARHRAAISDRQKGRIASSMREDPDRTAQSESFRAMSHDIALFGHSAFEVDSDDDTSPA